MMVVVIDVNNENEELGSTKDVNNENEEHI